MILSQFKKENPSCKVRNVFIYTELPEQLQTSLLNKGFDDVIFTLRLMRAFGVKPYEAMLMNTNLDIDIKGIPFFKSVHQYFKGYLKLKFSTYHKNLNYCPIYDNSQIKLFYTVKYYCYKNGDSLFSQYCTKNNITPNHKAFLNYIKRFYKVCSEFELHEEGRWGNPNQYRYDYLYFLFKACMDEFNDVDKTVSYIANEKKWSEKNVYDKFKNKGFYEYYSLIKEKDAEYEYQLCS